MRALKDIFKIKSGSKKPVPGKRLALAGIIAFVLLTGAAVAIYALSNRKDEQSSASHNGTDTYNINGQDIKIPKEFIKLDEPAPTTEPESLDTRIARLEEKVSNGGASHDVYYRLAQLYYFNKDMNSSIKYYEQAKNALDASDPGYKEKQQQLDEAIARVKAESP